MMNFSNPTGSLAEPKKPSGRYGMQGIVQGASVQAGQTPVCCPDNKGAENPQAHSRSNFKQSVDNLLNTLRTGIESILERINQGNEGEGGVLNIGPVKIDDASITALANQIGVAFETQVSRVITAINEAVSGASEGATATDITGRIEHNLRVNHNGTINVDSDEVINQIMPDLKSYVRDQLMRSANGNPAPPSPTKNTGTGTQKGFKGTPYGL